MALFSGLLYEGYLDIYFLKLPKTQIINKNFEPKENEVSGTDKAEFKPGDASQEITNPL